MNSHEYANKLKELADFLLAKPEFETDGEPRVFFWYWSDKQGFLGAVKALGSGEKKWSTDDLTFYPAGVPDGIHFELQIRRVAICRLVREAEYECEPLLSQAEEAEIGA